MVIHIAVDGGVMPNPGKQAAVGIVAKGKIHHKFKVIDHKVKIFPENKEYGHVEVEWMAVESAVDWLESSNYDDSNYDLKYATLPSIQGMTLTGEILGGVLHLTWSTLEQTDSYWIYGATDDVFFIPGFIRKTNSSNDATPSPIAVIISRCSFLRGVTGRIGRSMIDSMPISSSSSLYFGITVIARDCVIHPLI